MPPHRRHDSKANSKDLKDLLPQSDCLVVVVVMSVMNVGRNDDDVVADVDVKSDVGAADVDAVGVDVDGVASVVPDW